MIYLDLPPEQPVVEVVEIAQANAQPAEFGLPSLESADEEPDIGPLNAEPVELEEPAPEESTEDASEAENADTDIDLIPVEVETNSESNADPASDPTLTPAEFASQLRLSADFQEYDPTAQIITARGNVVLRLNDAIIETDELWLNLVNRYVLADGEVLLTRGSQIVRGSRAEYNFIQQAGVVVDAVGTLYLPDVGGDLSSPLEGASPATRRAYDPLGDRDLRVDSDGSVQIATSPGTQTSGGGDDGSLRQLRFETGALEFDVEGWRANDVRITNDPFSPPELEVRAESLLLRNISPTQDELLLKRPRLVFDDGFALPLLRRRILLSRGSVDSDDLSVLPVGVGVDGTDRGGFFVGRKIPVYERGETEITVTPEFFAARAFSDESDSPIDLDNFGVAASLDTQLSPQTSLEGDFELNSLELSDITEKLRTSIRARRPIGNHRLEVQYSYRERLFNGTLGFQDVQSSFGAVVLSPEFRLGENGPRLTYQGSAQLINAESDRDELINDSGRATLGRFQASVELEQTFNLWRGKPRPATQSEGLRFTPEPVVPFLDLLAGIRTTGTYYTSSDIQGNLVAEIGIEGQIGHLARNFADYTRYKVAYSQSFIGGATSPFLFDREVDRNILTLGLNQQVYGPFIAGFETAFSLSEGRAISNIYTLEYTRRTYGLLLRFDTIQDTGSIGFRLSNFGWVGDTDPFDTPRVRRVRGGVIERP